MNEQSTMVIFGASGDLTRRKLVPALFRLYSKGRLAGRAVDLIENGVVGYALIAAKCAL